MADRHAGPDKDSSHRSRGSHIDALDLLKQRFNTGPLRPRPARTPRLRAAVAGVVLLAVASSAAAVVWDRPERWTVQVLAMGAGELSPTLRDAAERCLQWKS